MSDSYSVSELRHILPSQPDRKRGVMSALKDWMKTGIPHVDSCPEHVLHARAEQAWTEHYKERGVPVSFHSDSGPVLGMVRVVVRGQDGKTLWSFTDFHLEADTTDPCPPLRVMARVFGGK